MSSKSVNEKIHKVVEALEPGTIFESGKLLASEPSSRRISSILKSRIRCPENPEGDLKYVKSAWMKLEPNNA